MIPDRIHLVALGFLEYLVHPAPLGDQLSRSGLEGLVRPVVLVVQWGLALPEVQ